MTDEPLITNDEPVGDDERMKGSRIPPYISYRTFLTLLEELKTSMPPQVDRSVLRRFSGGMQNQLTHALKALGLIDDNRVPRPTLKTLVDTLGTEEFKVPFRQVMKTTYPYVFELDLMSATPTMFADKFKEGTGAKEDILRKCRTFFLHAAKEVGIPLGPRIEQGTFPRAKSNGTKRAKPATKQREDNNPPLLDPKPDAGGSVVEKLLTKFPDFDPSWPDEIKKQWFDGFQRFMSGAGIKKGDTE